MDLWPSHKDNLIKALESRLQERTKNMPKFLDERAQKEVADITAIWLYGRSQKKPN
ncbi:MAG: hypothetical protein ABFS56_33905 [Pseudomonadota bacterium]